MLRDKNGRFIKGNEGFWLDKKRISMRGENNWKWVGGDTIKNCLVCKKRFTTRGKRRITGKFCSKSCKSKWLFTGERNPRWNGGVPREQREQLPEYREWRDKIYRNDGWKCKICGTNGRQIIAHHIKTYKDFPKLRFEVSNGITLCRSCHCKLHTIHKRVTDFTEILNDYTSDTIR